MNLSSKAERFRALHRGPPILVLPNAWDAASARIYEDAGFPSIATTSAGIAFSLGYPDGQRISRDEMLDAVRRIAAAVRVPVSADLEAGYGETPEAAGDLVRLLVAAGAIGLNLEDAWETGRGTSLAPLALQEERIRAAREAARAAAVPVVVNARTDVYLRGLAEETARFDAAVGRANAYLRAGADCAFIPGVHDPQLIARLAAAVEGPLNILAGPGTPSTAELQRLGVRRVSVGSGPMRATLGLIRRIASELLTDGTYRSFLEGAVPYGEVNALLAGAPRPGE